MPGEMERATGLQGMEIPGHLSAGIQLLLQAFRYAHSVNRDPWQFAVEISELRRSGMSHGDLRWLICRGLLVHGHEVHYPGESRREFRPSDTLELEESTCFCLTAEGVAAAANPSPRSVATCLHPVDALPAPQPAPIPLPHWDGELHRLVVGELIVKEFRVPSPNQEAVLAALEEEGWPARIDDPLPRVHYVDAKRRLHDTIKSLNRNQRRPLISFQGDGTGEGVRWELMSAEGVGNSNGQPS